VRQQWRRCERYMSAVAKSGTVSGRNRTAPPPEITQVKDAHAGSVVVFVSPRAEGEGVSSRSPSLNSNTKTRKHEIKKEKKARPAAEHISSLIFPDFFRVFVFSCFRDSIEVGSWLSRQ
jgi:hypothetical protein